MANIKSYIINKLIGLILLSLFCFSLSSILNAYFDFTYFETLGPESVIYFILSGFGFVIIDLFSFASLFLPLFFLIIGYKKIVGINVRFIFFSNNIDFLKYFFY